ncbi:hypothetical protein K492DRAFT_200218 [Lichtheimia hyalospora FSU 10163]|nr:hypothetical protein K492DRAFT_200218 [Lichtheimia hyalospora FSU 10163]
MNGIALNSVLHKRPNIESLTCNVMDVEYFISVFKHIYTKLKTLSFVSITQSLGQDDIVAFLKRFPSLECPVLPRCQSSRPLATIDQYCPLLRSLAYTPGFHSFVMDAEVNFDPQDVIPLLTRH